MAAGAHPENWSRALEIVKNTSALRVVFDGMDEPRRNASILK
jgi:hypothetical protein